MGKCTSHVLPVRTAESSIHSTDDASQPLLTQQHDAATPRSGWRHPLRLLCTADPRAGPILKQTAGPSYDARLYDQNCALCRQQNPAACMLQCGQGHRGTGVARSLRGCTAAAAACLVNQILLYARYSLIPCSDLHCRGDHSGPRWAMIQPSQWVPPPTYINCLVPIYQVPHLSHCSILRATPCQPGPDIYLQPRQTCARYVSLHESATAASLAGSIAQHDRHAITASITH